MDWDYITSLSADNLTDEEKDDLFNKVTWFDVDNETFLPKDIVLLFKIAQEILKYKSIQVQTLLSELDDIAAHQGEQEAKKISDSEAQSLQSKRSGSLDLEELETKYANLKLKYRKVLKALEKLNSEVRDLKQTNKLLESDRLHLQNELQQSHQNAANDNESSSDVSEIVKDREKELIENLHQKNVHISKLLDDIETVEKDNIILREKLTNIKDELKEGTNQLNLTTSELTTCKLKIEEMQEIISTLRDENDALKINEQDMLDEKIDREKQIDEYSHEIEARVDKWKDIIDSKNKELQDLKSKLNTADLIDNTKLNKTSSNSSSNEDNPRHIETEVLLKVILEREGQILQLTTEIQSATDEMDSTVLSLTKLKNERDLFMKKNEDLVDLVKDLKGQMKGVHGRCQELQQLLSFAENATISKDDDLKSLIDQIKNNGNIELADLLSEGLEMKNVILSKDKQIVDLVRTANKLQKNSDRYLKENSTLRDRLGLSKDDHVGIKLVKFDNENVRNAKLTTEKIKLFSNDEKIKYRLEIENLTKSVSNLANQVISLGEKPNFDGDSNNIVTFNNKTKDDMIEKQKYQRVVEENEALRRGLHEILNSVQENETDNLKEIRSETLEQLLLALDAKHISGWYHPAMRLQAELHTIKGVNSELRDQLRNAKLELEEHKKHSLHITGEIDESIIENLSDASNADIIQYLKKHIYDILNSFKTEEEKSCKLVAKLEDYRKDFLVIQNQLSILYKQYSDEKQEWVKRFNDDKIKIMELGEKVEILDSKIKIALNFTGENAATEDEKLKKIFELSESFTIANRKCLFLQDDEVKYINEINKLRQNFMNFQQRIQASEDKSNKNKALMTEMETVEVNNSPIKMQNETDDIIKKYRNLLAQFETCTENTQKESELLNSIIEMLKKEKLQAVDKLFDALNKLNAFENSTCSVDKAIENLTKKLAQSEVNEMTEKQRADHTNNLYELVKEQLKKSEEKFGEKDKSIEELKKRNLSRQDELKDLQDKVMYFVDAEVHKDMKNNYSNMERNLKEISNELTTTKLNLKLSNAKVESGQFWSNSEEYKFLSLKHQVVDLQAVSDDKAIIARLSSDVVAARLAEADMQKKLNLALNDLKDVKDEHEECLENQNIKLDRHEHAIKGLGRRNELLEDILRKLRQEYYGFVPLSTQSRFIENVHYSLRQKHKILETLQKTQIEQQCCLILKEQLAKEIENIEDLKRAKDHKGKYPPLLNWYQERNNLQLQEIKYKRQSEYMDHQLKQANERIKEQDNHILKLEEEHLQLLNNPEELLTKITYSPPTSPKNSSNTISSESTISKAKILKCSETQTYFEFEVTAKENEEYENNLNVSLQKDLSECQLELGNKERMIEELNTRIKELEVNINLFKTQLGDKQSQITFYEKHIVELQTKKEELANNDTIATSGGNNENEIANLQTINNELKTCFQEKDKIVLNLQTLLKQDRDEHSLAAARMQNELKRLYDIVNLKNSSVNEDKTNQPQSTSSIAVDQQQQDEDSSVEPTPKVVVEQYILQVHALEKHTTDLHTTVSTLSAQLQASREEAVRWRALANDRLAIMEQFGKEMTEQHKKEIDNYTRDADKWRQEVVTLQQVISKHRNAFYDMKAEVEKHRLEDKDSRIHELTLKLRQQQSELRKKMAISVDDKKFEEQEIAREQLAKEHDTLKKRFEQLMNRERNGREELRSLRTQLIKRPTLSARSDSSTSTQQVQQQSQRKIKTLQDEIDILQEKLQQQSAIIDSHRSKVSMDFEKWSKQKQYQQLSEKLKQKVKDKQVECEKLLETNAGFRIMFERSEKEKHNLEVRIKSLKSQSASSVNIQRYEQMVVENTKLLEELDVVKIKLNAQQHHSGALGAAMLQEKLEAQERKLAVMEVAATGTLEVRLELERLGNLLNSVQKSNLRLEAENLELKLDLEQNAGEIPHLKEQITHLENYITALKTEQTQQFQMTGSGDHNRTPVSGTTAIMSDVKKIQELDRTVVVLKRVVDKLQAENKRLISVSRPCSDRSDHSSSDRYRRDYYILKDLHIASTRKLTDLQTQLDTANETIKHLSAPVIRQGSAGIRTRPPSPPTVERQGVISCQTCFLLQGELNRVNEQLAHKTELLEKVKVLLQKAAAKEKGLLHEVANLKSLIPIASSSQKVD